MLWVQKSVKERESKEREIEHERRERVLMETTVVAATLTADVATAVAATVELFCCVFSMDFCHARWDRGSCLHGFWFGILEVRLKQCSFRLLVLCMLGQLLFFIETGSFKADLTKIKHVNIAMCQLTAETNCNGWIANKTKLHGVKSKF